MIKDEKLRQKPLANLTESHAKQVLHHFFTKIMIYSIDLIFREQLGDVL